MEETNNRIVYCEVCSKTVPNGTAICPDCSEVVETLMSIGIGTGDSIQALRAIYLSPWLIKKARRRYSTSRDEKLQSFGTKCGTWGRIGNEMVSMEEVDQFQENLGKGYLAGKQYRDWVHHRHTEDEAYLNFLIQSVSAEEFAKEYMQFPQEPIVATGMDEFSKKLTEIGETLKSNLRERGIIICGLGPGVIGPNTITAANELTGGIGLSDNHVIHERIFEMKSEKCSEAYLDLEPNLHKKDERKYLPKFNNHKNKKKK